MKINKSNIFLIGIFALAASLFLIQKEEEVTGHHHHHHDHDHDHGHSHDALTLDDEQIAAAGLEFKPASSKNLKTLLKKTGKLTFDPDKLIHITPLASGLVKSVQKNAGDDVQEKDVLAIFKSRMAAEKKAEFLSALRQEEIERKQMEREQILFDKGMSSASQYLKAKNDYKAALFSLELSKHHLTSLGYTLDDLFALDEKSDLNHYEIKSPMKGLILNRHISVGETLENNEEIFTIADPSILWMEIPLFPDEMQMIKKGQKVVLGTSGNHAVRAIIPQYEDNHLSGTGVITVNNEEGVFIPGSFLQANIILEEKEVPIAVEKDAIFYLEGAPHIFIKTGSTFEPRDVDLGREDDDFVEILSGLAQGEIYVSKNAFILKADLGKEEIEHDHG